MMAFLRTNWLHVLIALVVASGLIWGVFTRNALVQARKDVTALSEALSASEAENGTLRKLRTADSVSVVVQQDTRKAIATKEAKGRAETIKAIEANPEWANQPVPRDILDSLRP